MWQSIPATWNGPGWRCSRRHIRSSASAAIGCACLSAAFRNHMHWSEFIGGEVVISPPYSWQVRFNASDVEVRPRIHEQVPGEVVETLIRKFPDFRRSYTEDGLSPAEFDSFGPTVRTLRQFITACHDLDGLVRDFLLPNPDVS